jgi:uncharacterized protein (DUF697 family)
VRYAGRELTKLVPAFGETAGALWGASASAASTYAIGRAACAYFGTVRRGGRVDVEAVRRAYADAFARSATLFRREGETP